MSHNKGLEGVVAGETEISNVQGDMGRLTYRGYAIEELSEQQYLDVMWLVLFSEMPNSSQSLELREFLEHESHLEEYELEIVSRLPINMHPMKMLQALVPIVKTEPTNNKDAGSIVPEVEKGLRVVAKIPSLLIAFNRHKSGLGLEDILVNDVKQPYLEKFLQNLTGVKPLKSHVQVLNVIQILQMEHSFNAGTFASMVVGSTLADVESVIAAAIGALSGSLHGGADQAALEAADQVGVPAKAAEFVHDLLKNKGRLMGMGHREYKVVDPRSVILKPLVKDLCAASNFSNSLDILEAIEAEFSEAMRSKGKDVHANLEFYKGIAMLAIGIPRDYFTAVFAMARSVGWLAHFVELRRDNRIYRPKALYVGKDIRSLRQSAR